MFKNKSLFYTLTVCSVFSTHVQAGDKGGALPFQTEGGAASSASAMAAKPTEVADSTLLQKKDALFKALMPTSESQEEIAQAAAASLKLLEKSGFNPQLLGAEKIKGEEAPSYKELKMSLLAAPKAIFTQELQQRLDLCNSLPVGMSLGMQWCDVVRQALPKEAQRLFAGNVFMWGVKRKFFLSEGFIKDLKVKREAGAGEEDARWQPLNEAIHKAFKEASGIAIKENVQREIVARQLRTMGRSDLEMPDSKAIFVLDALGRYVELLDNSFLWTTETHKGPTHLGSLALLHALPSVLQVLRTPEMQALLIETANSFAVAAGQ